jgi:hypothetical protein
MAKDGPNGRAAPDDARRLAWRKSSRKRRDAARALEGLPPTNGTGRGGRRQGFIDPIWSDEDSARIEALMKDGVPPMKIATFFPAMTPKQVLRKTRAIRSAQNAPIGVSGLGLSVGCGARPTAEMLAERDAQFDAEYEAMVHLDPNIGLLGDPSPQRRARQERILKETPPPERDERGWLSISARRKDGKTSSTDWAFGQMAEARLPAGERA